MKSPAEICTTKPPKLTDRERANQRRIAAALAKGRHLVFGTPIEICPDTAEGESLTMASIDPTKNIPGAPSPAAAKKIRQLADVLGLEDEGITQEAIDAAVQALFDPMSPENVESSATAIKATARRLGLSEREGVMLAERRIDPRRYAANKARLAPAKRR